jgi:O-methyltransferase
MSRITYEYSSPVFYGLRDSEQFFGSLKKAHEAFVQPRGFFAADNLVTFNRNLSFLADDRFVKAFQEHASTDVEQAIVWRIATVAWGAANGMRLGEGDFVECACYKGITARIICDYLDFGSRPDRHYYLYDLFEHDASMPHHQMPEHGNSLYNEVLQRFAHLPNVTITQGKVPESFTKALPDKIAFLHLDLNNAEAEIGALEILFDRMIPGAVMVLDDYGWLAYNRQKDAEDDWLGKRGYRVLELPTGQGLLVK